MLPPDADPAPSRSQQRRDALAVLELAERLVALTPTRLRQLELPSHLLDEIAVTRKVTAHIARKRQLGFLAKQLRREDEELLEAIREKLALGQAAHQREVAAQHHLEHWRDRLLDEGDRALQAFLDEHPQADRQRLRALLRQAAREREHGKPPRAARELLRCLRES